MKALALSRRELLRAAAAAGLAGAIPSRALATPDAGSQWTPGQPLPWLNWSGLERCVPARRLGPASEAELGDLLRGASGTVRPAGAGHSFSALVPTDDALLFLDGLAGVRAADRASLTAEVWAGTRLSLLGPELASHGQAMPNLPDIDQQTLGGALATSTHGTGAKLGSIASTARALALVTPGGELLECNARRNAEVFHAACTSLGALGVVSRVTLQNRRPFRLVERSRFVPLDDLLANLDAARDGAPHFEFYAFPHADVALEITTKENDYLSEVSPPDDPGALYLLRTLFRITRVLPGSGRLYSAFLARQPATARAGWSYEVLTHSRTVRFNEMEYTVPAARGPECLRAVLDTIRERDLDVCFPIECRFVRADDVWLSMFHQRDGFSISIHQFADLDWRPYFAAIEPIFWRFEGRPHWGKLHSLDAARLAELYPRFADFQEVRRSLDPQRRMANAYLSQILGP